MVVAMGKTETDRKQDEEMGPSIIIYPQPVGSNSRGPGLLTTDPAPAPFEIAHLHLYSNPSVQTVGHTAITFRA